MVVWWGGGGGRGRSRSDKWSRQVDTEYRIQTASLKPRAHHSCDRLSHGILVYPGSVPGSSLVRRDYGPLDFLLLLHKDEWVYRFKQMVTSPIVKLDSSQIRA